MVTAMAVAVIRPEHAIGADLQENLLFYEKLYFRPILVISGPSRPQKWIRLEILRWKMVWGGLEVKIKAISWQNYIFYTNLTYSPSHLVLQGVVGIVSPVILSFRVSSFAPSNDQWLSYHAILSAQRDQ